MTKKIVFQFLFLFLAAFPTTFQAQPYTSSQWKIFNRDNSPLPSNNISCIVEDKTGIYWIGCGSEFKRDTTYKGGLVRFDGSNWLLYDSLNSPLKRIGVQDITVDKDNKILIATFKGIFIFDGVQWQQYSTSNSPLPSNEILNVVVDHQNNYWFGIYNYGIAKLSKNIWTFYNYSNAFSGIGDLDFMRFDSLHNLWVGTSLYGLWRFNGTSWKKIMPGYANDKIANSYTSLMVDRNRQIWLTYTNYSRGGVIATLIDTVWQEYNSLNFGVRPRFSFDTAVADSSNRKFFGCNVGLILYNDTTWTIFNTSNSPIPANTFTRGIVDSKNNKIYGIESSFPSFQADYGLIFYNENGVVLSSIEEPSPNLIKEFKLYQNYPNPFNPSTNIKFQIPNTSHVTLKVYDILGREITTLVDEVKESGIHNSKFSIRQLTEHSTLSSGVCLYQLRAGSFVETKKMIIIK